MDIDIMGNWLYDVPREILEELNKFGLTVGAKLGDPLCAIWSTSFAQKGNKKMINDLKDFGWTLNRSYFMNGVKYVSMCKHI
mgnify:CR=1 FL=1